MKYSQFGEKLNKKIMNLVLCFSCLEDHLPTATTNIPQTPCEWAQCPPRAAPHPAAIPAPPEITLWPRAARWSVTQPPLGVTT